MNPPPPVPALILFDAAGTLLETAEPVENVYLRIFARHGISSEAAKLRESFRETFAHLPDPDFAEHAGNDDTGDAGDAAERAWWQQVVGHTLAAAGHRLEPDDFAACFDDLFDHYAGGDAWKVFAEAPALIDRLKRRGHRLAIVSNFDRRLHRVLAELGVAECFDLVLTSADVRARKPAPNLLLRAVEHFGLGTQSACLVGDSAAADGGAAAAVGMPVFILDRPRSSLLDFERWLGEDF